MLSLIQSRIILSGDYKNIRIIILLRELTFFLTIIFLTILTNINISYDKAEITE